MYHDNVAYANTPVNAPQPQPILVSIEQDLRSVASERWDLIYAIEDRLHIILNLREPSKPESNSPEAEPNSFVEQMKIYHEIQISQNNKLRKILDHITKLV